MATSSICHFLSFNPLSKSHRPPPPPPLLSTTTTATTTALSATPLPPLSQTLRTPITPIEPQTTNSTDLLSVVCPSLAYSNTLFFKSAYNVQVIVEDNEPEEKLLNRFRREVMRAGVIQECKRRRFFENSQDKVKRKSREAAKRNRRRRPFTRTPMQDKPEASTTKKEADDGDNWDLPAQTLPY